MPGSDGLRLAIIIGTRECSYDPSAAEWLAAIASRRESVEVDVLDLTEAWLPEVRTGDGRPKPHAVQDLAPWLAAADAFVVVTPEHNHTIPEPLKTAIAWYQEEWKAKPVAFLTHGKTTCTLRSPTPLRQAFSELHTATIPESISSPEFGESAEAGGTAACDQAADVMLDQLLWWARTLRNGRAENPYNG